MKILPFVQSLRTLKTSFVRVPNQTLAVWSVRHCCQMDDFPAKKLKSGQFLPNKRKFVKMIKFQKVCCENYKIKNFGRIKMN